MAETTDGRVPPQDAQELHHALVEELKRNGLLPHPAVEAAFRAVPRHLFLPGVPLDTVYTDDAILTKQQDGVPVSSSSQPAVMAIMLDQLGLEPGHQVLEIGAGTGYNAALMSHLVAPSGQVVTVDIDEDIVQGARAHLAAAGLTNVRVSRADGALGYPDGAPYDRIILTVGAWDIAPAWAEQLRPGGRLVLPLALNGCVQKLVAFERMVGHLASVSVREGGFMPLRGAWAGPRTLHPLGPDQSLVLALARPRAVDPERAFDLLTGAYHDLPSSLTVPRGELGGLAVWLALHAPSMCGAMARGDAAARGLIPSTFGGSAGFRATFGLLEDAGLCLLASPEAHDRLPDMAEAPLAVRSYGSSDEPAQHLLELLRDWDAAGRPFTAGLCISAHPKDGPPADGAEEAVILKPHTRLILQAS